MTTEDIKKIVEDCRRQDLDIKVRDIAYVILERTFQNEHISYRAIFGHEVTDNDVKMYAESDTIKKLKGYLVRNMPQNGKTESTGKLTGSNAAELITFEENKAALVDMLDEIRLARMNGDLDYKDALKLETEIRTKLNDKFAVADTTEQQYVIVECKYNSICEHCNHEIYIPTKEDLMKEYNLVER